MAGRLPGGAPWSTFMIPGLPGFIAGMEVRVWESIIVLQVNKRNTYYDNDGSFSRRSGNILHNFIGSLPGGP